MSDSSQEDEEGVYEVERIVKKRIEPDGKIRYFIKWKDYSEKDNTWEPIENLECQDLIKEFENNKNKIVIDQRVKKNDNQKKPSSSSAQKQQFRDSFKESKENVQLNSQQKNGFDKGLTPEKILGATDASGEFMFLFKWKDTNQASLVPLKIARKKCPQLVIEYLESRVIFVNE